MPTQMRPTRAALSSALVVVLVAAVLGAGWFRAPRAAADNLELAAALCQDAPAGCQILWESGAPPYLDSTTAYLVRVMGNPGVTVQLAMYEVLYDTAGTVSGVREFRRTADMTTNDHGVVPAPLAFSPIDPASPPASGYGFVGFAGLAEDTTDFSDVFGQEFLMAHSRPLVLDGLSDEQSAGQEATLRFLGGTPGQEYQLWFTAPGSEPVVVSHEPVAAQPPPNENTIAYTVPGESGAGSYRLTSSDDYFAPLEWPVTIIRAPDPSEDPGPNGQPDPGGDPHPTAEPDLSGHPDPTASPSASGKPDPTQTPESPPSDSEPTTSPTNPRPPTSSAAPPPPTASVSSQPSPATTATAPPSAAPSPTPEPTQFGSAPAEAEERVRTQERAERVTNAAPGAADAPRWSGGLVGGLATAAVVGATTWVWRSRRETVATLARWEDE